MTAIRVSGMGHFNVILEPIEASHMVETLYKLQVYVSKFAESGGSEKPMELVGSFLPVSKDENKQVVGDIHLVDVPGLMDEVNSLELKLKSMTLRRDSLEKDLSVVIQERNRYIQKCDNQANTIKMMGREIDRLKEWGNSLSDELEVTMLDTIPKITWVNDCGIVTIYQGDELLVKINQPYTPYVLRLLGYEVDQIDATYQDMEEAVTGKPYEYRPGEAARIPQSLKQLTDHLEKKRIRLRDEQIKHHEQEYQRLLKEKLDEGKANNGK